jgi:nucleotide-binding universal stress UspA family protein
MYTRIFVPVDNSDTSNRALDEAIKLAKKEGAVLLLAHIVETPTHSIHSRDELEMLASERPEMKIGAEIMKAAALRASESGITPEEIALNIPAGLTVAKALHDAAISNKADLIVMGTHGRSGLKHLLLGSVAEGMLRIADLPVLMLRS